MDDLQELAKKVSSLEKRVAQLEAHQSGDVIRPIVKEGKGLSIKEFMISQRPSGDVQKTLAIAYYLEKYERLTSFNVEDLARGFPLAKESTPENINDKINMNIRKGHIAEAKEKKDRKKAWIVTNAGEQFVENGFKDKDK